MDHKKLLIRLRRIKEALGTLNIESSGVMIQLAPLHAHVANRGNND
jgi:hypothetical protein